MSIASTGDPFALYARLEAYPTITQAEIKAAATYLVPERSVRVVVVSPDRVAELALVLRDSDPNARPLAPMLEAAAGLFAQALDLRDQRSEVDREARAIALLKQRADVATKQATTKPEKAAIKTYLDHNEMGASQRTKRLKVQERALQAAEAALLGKQRKLLEALATLVRTSRANLADRSQAMAIELLATPLDQQVTVPAVYVGDDGTRPDTRLPALGQRMPIRPGLEGSEQLALNALAAFALEARGLAASAQSARSWILTLAPAHLKSTLGPEAQALAELAIDLASDTDVRNVPLADAPTSVLRPSVRQGLFQ